MTLTAISTEAIDRRADARPISFDTVGGLVDSIGTVGLINPIRVRRVGDRYEVIAGGHRFEACQQLGLAEIDCDVVDDDDLHAELAMIDENLCRAELTPSDRAIQTARRKAIYIELNPATANGVNQHSSLRQVGEPSERFTADTAKATGQSERTVQRVAERGEKILPEVLDMIRGTRLDTGAYLDKLKGMSGSEQFQATKRDLAFDKKQAREARKAEQEKLDRERDAFRDTLPESIKAQQRAKEDAATKRNDSPADDGVQIDALRAIADELREANAAFEADIAALNDKLATFEGMRVQFEMGGFEKVIAGKDEEIRVLSRQVESQSRDKVKWKNSADYWKAEAAKLGWSNIEIIPLDGGSDTSELLTLDDWPGGDQ